MPNPFLVLILGGLFALVLGFVGAKLRYGRAYGLIAGYDRASPAQRERNTTPRAWLTTSAMA